MPVQGSNSWVSPALKRRLVGPEWWQIGSPLEQFLFQRGCVQLNPEFPFLWTTTIGGLEWFWRVIKQQPIHHDHQGWATAGWNLKLYFEFQQVPVCDRAVITYSHGLQPVLYACGVYGLELDRFLIFGGPVRADMRWVAEKARLRIRRWLSVADPEDRLQDLGQWFDGSFLDAQCHPLADQCDLVPGIGHGKVLHDPAYFNYWMSFGWLDFLTNAVQPRLDEQSALTGTAS